MSSNREEGPVYYREIQKNAYLKRIPNEIGSGLLRPLGQKKVQYKPMWTSFCVHNGRTPYLEQYPEAGSSSALSHRPTWRVCLNTARHVTASVKPHIGEEYDFLIDTDNGPIRMLAPNWETMQDWVTTLRTKLHELKILSKGENVYAAQPVAPPPRVGCRDPNSPLPPTPSVPLDRVPGIEVMHSSSRVAAVETNSIESNSESPNMQSLNDQSLEENHSNENATNNSVPSKNTLNQSTENRVPNLSVPNHNVPNHSVPNQNVPNDIINIPNQDINIKAMPSTSQDFKTSGFAKICGRNICLNDNVLRPNVENDMENNEFLLKADNSFVNCEISDVDKEQRSQSFKQRVVVNSNESLGVEHSGSDDIQRSNITVIKVSNKEPPHTAIPVLSSETDIFNFDFNQKVPVKNALNNSIVNIVKREMTDDTYGTVFSESDYGHLSLATTVRVTDSQMTDCQMTDVKPVDDVKVTDVAPETAVYERLCLASTSDAQDRNSPLPLRKLKACEKIRKSSLPNLELEQRVPDPTYEYLCPSSNNFNVDIGTNHVKDGIVRNNVVKDMPSGESVSVQANSVSVTNLNVSTVRCNIERSHSQNAHDASRVRQRAIRIENHSPKRSIKIEKTECTQTKPIWRRGLTELSLLTRLRGLGQSRRHDSPTRHDVTENDRSVKVVRRSRAEGRPDNSRRRSSSLSNGHTSGSPATAANILSLRQRQATALRAEQKRGAAAAAALPARDHPLFCDYDKQVWVACWRGTGPRVGGRPGDRVAAVRGVPPRDAQHARQLCRKTFAPVDILFHRVPLAKIYVLHRRNNESLGIDLDGESCVRQVVEGGPAARIGLPPAGSWAVTEVNNRSLDLLKSGEEEMKRLSMHGDEVSVLIQPAPLVKKIRSALKANRSLLSTR